MDEGRREHARAEGALVACGTMTCNAATQYCQIAHGGPAPPDGGSNITYACNPIPVSCASALTCACIEQGGGCSCKEASGKFTTECFYP